MGVCEFEANMVYIVSSRWVKNKYILSESLPPKQNKMTQGFVADTKLA